MLKPVNDQILVKIIKMDQTKSGLYVTKDNQEQECGKVIELPAEFTDDAPDFCQRLKKGQMIYFKSYSAIPMKVEGEDLHFVKYDEIIAVEEK